MRHKLGMARQLLHTILALGAGLALAAGGQQAGASPHDDWASGFARCNSGSRISCVVDGDTFWYRGQKIRIADINAPEVSEPRCPAEGRLGRRATQRLVELLNQGPFTLRRSGPDTDRYGRLLRLVTRDGESLGEILVSEDLAERWKGYRRNWC